MTHDNELDVWREQWQARDGVPAELRERVAREIRAGRHARLIPVGVTVIFGGGTLAWALLSREAEAIVLAVATWAFIAITWLTGLTLERRIGQRRAPEGATTTAYLVFTIQVCRGKRAAMVAAAALYPVFLTFMLIWRYQTADFESVGAYLLSTHVLLVAGVTLVLGIVGVRKYRVLGAELENLRTAQRRFQDQP